MVLSGRRRRPTRQPGCGPTPGTAANRRFAFGAHSSNFGQAFRVRHARLEMSGCRTLFGRALGSTQLSPPGRSRSLCADRSRGKRELPATAQGFLTSPSGIAASLQSPAPSQSMLSRWPTSVASAFNGSCRCGQDLARAVQDHQPVSCWVGLLVVILCATRTPHGG